MALSAASTLGPLPTRIEELTPGLMVFFDRPSRLQSWAAIFGHEWRHAGVTVQVDDRLMIAGFAHGAKYHYLPVEKLANYRRIGVARVFSTDHEITMFNRWCRDYEAVVDEDFVYTTSAPLVGPLQHLARTRPEGPLKQAALRLIGLYCDWQTWRYGDKEAFGCSTFVRAAVDAAREQPLRLPMTHHPEDLVAYAQPMTSLDERIAQWLCAPTDLWRTVPEWDRRDLELCDAPRRQKTAQKPSLAPVRPSHDEAFAERAA